MTINDAPHPPCLDDETDPHDAAVSLALAIMALPHPSVPAVTDWIESCGTHLAAFQIDRLWRATAGLGRDGAMIRNALRRARPLLDLPGAIED